MIRHLRFRCAAAASNPKRDARLACCILVLATGHPAEAAVRSVGDALSCQYATIQAAIAAAATNDVIHVEPSHAYNEHLLITDKSLAICASACDEPLCTAKTHASVDGSGTIKVYNPLLRIQTTGSNSVTVSLSNIDFSNNHSTINGGGIAWSAQGLLTLTDVAVTGNDAPNGGGIYFNGSGTGASLTFGNNVSVSSNTTTVSGGGMRIEGSSSFSMNGSNDRIFQNIADSDDNDSGDGGGISVVSPATADIGTAVAANAAIYSNKGYNGGGIAFVGGEVDAGNTASTIHVTAGDLKYPVRIESNTATHFGGGVYLRPKVFASSTVNSVLFEAYGYRIDTNTASDGSAIYADTDPPLGDPSPGLAGGNVMLDRTTCLPQVECNSIAGNVFSVPYPLGGSPASVVEIKANGQLNARSVRMHDNAGEYLLQSSGSKAAVTFSLLYGNTADGALIAADSSSQHLQIDQCTIAGNTIHGPGAPIISGNLELLSRSLLDQPGTAAYSGSGSPAVFDIVATDIDGLPADPTITQHQPLFIDAANDDFRLIVARDDNSNVTASPGVDYTTAGIEQLDIAGRAYNQDMPGVGAVGDVRDLGAFEMQPITDRIFASGIGDPVLVAY